MCEFMTALIKHNYLTPSALIHLYIKALLSLNVTVGTKHFSLYSSSSNTRTFGCFWIQNDWLLMIDLFKFFLQNLLNLWLLLLRVLFLGWKLQNLFLHPLVGVPSALNRDAPIAIFMTDSDFRFFGSVTCRYRFLPILIFFLRTIIDRIYKQKSMQIQRKNIKINY